MKTVTCTLLLLLSLPFANAEDLPNYKINQKVTLTDDAPFYPHEGSIQATGTFSSLFHDTQQLYGQILEIKDKRVRIFLQGGLVQGNTIFKVHEINKDNEGNITNYTVINSWAGGQTFMIVPRKDMFNVIWVDHKHLRPWRVGTESFGYRSYYANDSHVAGSLARIQTLDQKSILVQTVSDKNPFSEQGRTVIQTNLNDKLVSHDTKDFETMIKKYFDLYFIGENTFQLYVREYIFSIYQNTLVDHIKNILEAEVSKLPIDQANKLRSELSTTYHTVKKLLAVNSSIKKRILATLNKHQIPQKTLNTMTQLLSSVFSDVDALDKIEQTVLKAMLNFQFDATLLNQWRKVEKNTPAPFVPKLPLKALSFEQPKHNRFARVPILDNMRKYKMNQKKYIAPSFSKEHFSNRVVRVLKVLDEHWAIVDLNPSLNVSLNKQKIVIFVSSELENRKPYHGQALAIDSQSEQTYMLKNTNLSLNVGEFDLYVEHNIRPTVSTTLEAKEIVAIPLKHLKQLHTLNASFEGKEQFHKLWNQVNKAPYLVLTADEKTKVISHMAHIIEQTLSGSDSLSKKRRKVNKKYSTTPASMAKAIYETAHCYSDETIPLSPQVLMAVLYEAGGFKDARNTNICGLARVGRSAKIDVVSSYIPNAYQLKNYTKEKLNKHYGDYLTLLNRPHSCIAKSLPPMNYNNNKDWCEVESNLRYAAAYYRHTLSKIRKKYPKLLNELYTKNKVDFMTLGLLSYKAGITSMTDTLERTKQGLNLSSSTISNLFTTIGKQVLDKNPTNKELVEISTLYRSGLFEAYSLNGTYIMNMPANLDAQFHYEYAKTHPDYFDPEPTVVDGKTYESNTQNLKGIYLRSLLVFLISRAHKKYQIGHMGVQTFLNRFGFDFGLTIHGITGNVTRAKEPMTLRAVHAAVVDVGDSSAEIQPGIKNFISALIDSAQSYRVDETLRYHIRKFAPNVLTYHHLMTSGVTDLKLFERYDQKVFLNSEVDKYLNSF